LLVYVLLNSHSTSLRGWLRAPQQLHRQSQRLRGVGSGCLCQLPPTHASHFPLSRQWSFGEPYLPW